ncbi:hypothetical protein HNP46_004818 [Pseudomonas nitritireducens]|uniref:Uncharacterized protein n=1 Tax=Pseudomonas nitroreducens TaxID=46680 RepID=A0A7W7KN74_PSENT|nr:hypothetical protein [Pseudomonas nitritireducens]MBB4865917.1 hypothetical protein [Pseudomonas nitritireducens]
MACTSSHYLPSRSYDLHREVDYPPEDLPLQPALLLPIYALRGGNFYLHSQMDSFNPNIGMIGQVVLGSVPHEWRIMAGKLLLGEIRADGYFWCGDGKRFRLVEVKSA